jgi:hypothetical protein
MEAAGSSEMFVITYMMTTRYRNQEGHSLCFLQAFEKKILIKIY